MMTKLYNPKTGEAIFSDKAAPWMGVAHEDAPAHERQMSSAFYVDGAWSVVAYVPDLREAQAAIDAELREIDLASIRSMREYLAALPDAPQYLKDHESAAAAKRAERPK